MTTPTSPSPVRASPGRGPERPTMVLLNPRAAGGRGAALAQPVREWLASYAPGVALVESDSIERSRATLQCLPRSSRVVLIGGDGTLHHMLPVLLTHRLALGVVPLGGGNDTARALGVAGMAWPKALELALRGPTRRMDVGELITPRLRIPFFSSLAAGFDAAVAARALAAPRWLDGRPRYLWATLAELAALRTQRIQLALDGAPCYAGEAIFASVLNTRSYGAGMPAAPGARIGDGRLDLLLAGPFGRIGALRMLPRLLEGTHLPHAKIQAWTFQSLQFESERELPLAADGEPLQSLRRFEVRVRAAAVQVVSAKRPRRREAASDRPAHGPGAPA
ncbi:diacylglycerol/lipid kinase family protein [Piscinibacter sp.]|uniref:diacylglycerol/lipid kinase family protein n=1 Tax=Piscinibacter sp. TaxID=1903157 RepID=UPI0039E720E0